MLQSNYAQFINKKRNRTGSLFRQRLKSRLISDGDANYRFTAFNYIHQNPFVAGLVTKLEEWEFSSFRNYAGLSQDEICNKELAFELIGFDKENFIKESYEVIDQDLIRKLLY